MSIDAIECARSRAIARARVRDSVCIVLTPEEAEACWPQGPGAPYVVDHREATRCFWHKRPVEPTYVVEYQGQQVRYARCGCFLWIEGPNGKKSLGGWGS